MASLDRTLLIAFGSVSLLFLALAAICFRQALRVADARDGDLKMFLWAAGGMFGLIVSGMSAAYIILPILFSGR